MGGISQDGAVLVAMIVETFFYGILTVLFGFTIRVLAFKPYAYINKRLLLTSIAMYILATIHLVTDAYRIMDTFVNFRSKDGGPIAYINALGSPTYLLKSTVYALQTLIGDSCIIYRCFIVWQRNIWVILLPLLLLVSCIVTGAGVLTNFSRISPNTEVFSLTKWVATFFTMSLATNVICTVLISFRIWSVDRATGTCRQSESTLRPVLAVVVESGAIYSASLVALLATFLSHSWAQYIVIDAVTPIIGIVFTMIIVRIGLSVAWQTQSGHAVATLQYNIPQSSSAFSESQSHSPAVHVTTSGQHHLNDPGNAYLSPGETNLSLPSWSLGITGTTHPTLILDTG